MATTGTATIDFGSTPTDGATFTIVDAALSGLTYVEAFFVGSDSTATNTADDHRRAGAMLRVTCDAPSGSNMNVEAHVLGGLVTGQFKMRYVGA